MVPAALYFGLFFFVPFGLIVCFSFWQDFDYKVIHHWTLENYRYFFSQPVYWHTMLKTLWMGLAATGITLGMAFPFSYWLARYVPAGLQKPLLVLVIVPFWTSYLLRVYSWLNILGDNGVVNSALKWMGLINQPLSLLNNRWTVVVVLVYLYFPFAVLTLWASLERFDWDQFKAAMDLGATPRIAITRILLPQIKPGITTAVIFVFIPILGEYLAPQLVGGQRGVMIGNLIVNFFTGAQYTRGAAAALLIAALIVVLLVIFRKSLEVEDAYRA